MNGADVIVILLVLAVLGLSVFFIWRAKKSGAKCVGCPYSKTCSGTCASCSGDCGSAKK